MNTCHYEGYEGNNMMAYYLGLVVINPFYL